MPGFSSPSSLTEPGSPGSNDATHSPVTPWVEVLVDCPGVENFFTYAIPASWIVQPGDILSVPFGSQQVGAIAIRLCEQLPPDRDSTQIRPLEEMICSGFFPPAYWALLQRVAEVYCTPLIQVIRTALPPGLLRRSQRRVKRLQSQLPESLGLSPAAQQIWRCLQSSKTGDYTWHYLQQQITLNRTQLSRGLQELQQQGYVESYLEPPAPVRPKLKQVAILAAQVSQADLKLTPRQQEVLDFLKRQGGELGFSELQAQCRVQPATLKVWAQQGLLILESREVLRAENGQELVPDHPRQLTPAQSEALATIQQISGSAQILLHGVTGSGKTEVYLQAIAPLLKQGKSALVLVPEIGLTPQLTDRFRARFGSQVCVYHSALSEGERYDTWRQMLTGTPQVVIGTRSAVFSPLPNLGLIILDEEHDSSFKQEQPSPCYHARTIARWRADLDHCPLILGSATPSLESWITAQAPEQAEPHFYLSLPERVEARPLPPIEIVDMRQELQEGNFSILSRSLQAALSELQARKQQGILFIPRRGHSTFVSCRSCGYVMTCPNCDVSLSYHHTHTTATQLLRCHYCNHTQLHPPRCPDCESPYFKFFGSGTQRVAQELSRQFPELRVIRFDSDTTRRKGAHRELIHQFAQQEADLLVGTQMLTKGLDLPQVTLVGVVAADGLLHLPDYRASERAFQVLTQVSGRAGRGQEPGKALIQTYSPSHPVLQAVQRQNYPAFAETELQQRAALNYPPYNRLILLRCSSPDPIAVQTTAQRLAARLQPTDPEAMGYLMLGPAPATIFRVARRYRWQILLKLLREPAQLPDWAELQSLCSSSVALLIDVDPLHC